MTLAELGSIDNLEVSARFYGPVSARSSLAILGVRVRVIWGVLVCWSTPAFPRGREHVASTPVKGTSPKIMGSMIGFVLVASTWALSGPVVQGCEKALIGPLPFFLFCSILMNFVFFHQI